MKSHDLSDHFNFFRTNNELSIKGCVSIRDREPQKDLLVSICFPPCGASSHEAERPEGRKSARPRRPCLDPFRAEANDSYEVAGVKPTERQKWDSIGANVTNETSAETCFEIQNEQFVEYLSARQSHGLWSLGCFRFHDELKVCLMDLAKNFWEIATRKCGKGQYDCDFDEIVHVILRSVSYSGFVRLIILATVLSFQRRPVLLGTFCAVNVLAMVLKLTPFW